MVDPKVADEILEVESRRRVYDFIRSNPGSHMREIRRRLDMTLGNLEYHLRYLERHDMITVREGGYNRYYVKHDVGVEDQKLLGLLRQTIPRRILIFLLLNPGSSHQDIHADFDVSASTLSYHIGKLIDAGVVEKERKGRYNVYSVVEPDEVAQALVTYQDSFLDEAVDGFVDAWLGFES